MKVKVVRIYRIDQGSFNTQRGCYQLTVGEKERYEETVYVQGSPHPVTTEIVEYPDQQEEQGGRSQTE